jgi:putative adhesin
MIREKDVAQAASFLIGSNLFISKCLESPLKSAIWDNLYPAHSSNGTRDPSLTYSTAGKLALIDREKQEANMDRQSQRVMGWMVRIVGVAALVALATPWLHSQSASGGSEQADRFQKTFSIANGGTLEVENYKGTIHVTGADTNQVSVDVTKHFEGSDADRKWWMENIQINFRNDSNRVAVEVKYPSCNFCWVGHDSTASVELEIHVPRQINVKLDSYKPDIRIAGIQGDIRVKSYKSPIEIADTAGAVRIDTYKDRVRLRNVNVRGPLEIKSYTAETEIEARSLGDSVTLENTKGSIVLRVPATAGLNVDFEGGRRSSFHSDFAMNSPAGSYDRSVRGTVNQGGTRVRLRTEKGSVSLEKLSGSL